MPISEITAALRWWFILFLFGITAFPITFRLLKSLPDKGYAFTKAVGLLIVSYFFWLLGSLGFLHNNLGGILLSWALFALSALLLGQWRPKGEQLDDSFLGWVRQNWRYLLFTEVLFLLIFATWVLVRAQNPAIVATEKPMEFAFLNSASRSEQIPPLDPWLSGFAISYYYFGYVMASVLSRLASVPESVGFNLMIAWVAAATALGAFGILYNLLRSDFLEKKRLALIAGLIAALAIPIAGNLEILLEIAYANEVAPDQLWEWLDVRDFSSPVPAPETPRYKTSSWWWWRSSRVIHEYHLSGRPEEGLEPIAEFPAFSLILGDMHPHVLALPYALLGTVFAFAWWQRESPIILDIRLWFSKRSLAVQRRTINKEQVIFVLATVILLGGLSFLNTWDVFIYLFLVLGAYLLNRHKRDGQLGSAILVQTVTLAILLVALSFLFYLPFYLGFRSQAGPPFLLPMAMRPTRLSHFFIIFGMSLIPLATMLVTLLWWAGRTMSKSERIRALRSSVGFALGLLIGLFLLMLALGWIIGINSEGRPRISVLLQELQIPIEMPSGSESLIASLRWSSSAVATLAPFFLRARINQPFLILVLSLMMVIAIFIGLWSLRRLHGTKIAESKIVNSLPFVLLLIGTGALLTLGPEFVYLRDNFGQRLNTIFKFYYQAWILFSISGIYGLFYLIQKFQIVGWVTSIIYGLLLFGSMLFPYYSVQSRSIEYRGSPMADNRLSLTIDGLDYMRDRNPDEYEAIDWLRNHVNGSPIIVEAVGGQYSTYGRIAASTGLPTLLGWAGHEYQWRGNTPEPAIREPVVKTIYSSDNWADTEQILQDYDVAYVYFGALERSTYDPQAEDKFAQNTTLAFQNDTVSIYVWQATTDNSR